MRRRKEFKYSDNQLMEKIKEGWNRAVWLSISTFVDDIFFQFFNSNLFLRV